MNNIWGIGHLRTWARNGSIWAKLPKETQRYVQRYLKLIKGARNGNMGEKGAK